MANKLVSMETRDTSQEFGLKRIDCGYVSSKAPARLVVVVDTEEEFNWSSERSRDSKSVKSLAQISRFQEIADRYGITPVYVVDYPVASQREACRPLKEIHRSGRCLIGAHLHPWVNPPFEEPVNNRNSFPGNLPRSLEAKKLHLLGELIGEQFSIRPTIYKAGRYGIGGNTASILEEQGYEIDLSICPHMDYSTEGGPSFYGVSAWPFWFGRSRRLLELPLTIGFTGMLRSWGSLLHRIASRRTLVRFHAVGILARLRLLDKIWLSPEGYLSAEHIRLVRALYQDGLRIFSFAFHSPSLQTGNTPYVSSEADLQRFLSRCRRFFDFFMGELGGIPSTPLELKAQLGGFDL
jgi:hypothetical protein